MTSRTLINSFLLTFFIGHSAAVIADNEDRHSVTIIPPTPVDDGTERPFVSGRVEVGFYTGSLSVEDFGSNLVTGLELTYFLTPKWLIQANYGISEVDRAAFETSDRPFLARDDRDFEYFSITGAYRIVEGRSFFGERSKFDSAIFAIAGPNRVGFAANKDWGLTFGLSYRMAFNDWLSANLDFREHMFERDFIGDKKRTLNSEMRIGLNASF